MFCRVCGGVFGAELKFGRMPIANSFGPALSKEEYRFDMTLVTCSECQLTQLKTQPDPRMMFHDEYKFFSSTSAHMREHFERLGQTFIQNFDLSAGGRKSRILEIGCNDGVFAGPLAENGFDVVGFEPSSNVADVARGRGVKVYDDFFTLDSAGALGVFDLVYSANVLCHIPEIRGVFEAIKMVLAEDGVFCFEDPYLHSVLKYGSFDQVYDEHVYLFSLTSVSALAQMCGLEVFDFEEIWTHGGSARYFLRHASFGSKQISVSIALQKEQIVLRGRSATDLLEKKTSFFKEEFLKQILSVKENGGRVFGYGATSKSTTILNLCDIDSCLIDCIYDNTPGKIGTFAPGSGIPIASFNQFELAPDDAIIMFAWNHADEILTKELELGRIKPGQWIIPFGPYGNVYR